MTETQSIVNAIRDGWKSDWILTVWYRSEHDRIIKRVYQSADVLKALSEKYTAGLEPIESLYREIKVGTTPESEQHTGGYSE